MTLAPREPAERFWPKFTRAPSGCWEWNKVNAEGYGRAQWHATPTFAHIAVYELLVGSVPEGLELDHLCRNRRCVNPSHLEAVTHAENMRRSRGYRLQTHCPKGHLYDEANTRWVKRKTKADQRVCRACVNAHMAAYYRDRQSR